MSYATQEGTYQPDGSWVANPGSEFRSLTVEEVADLEAHANTVTPVFEGENNATWAETHPVARDIYEARGLKPAGV